MTNDSASGAADQTKCTRPPQMCPLSQFSTARDHCEKGLKRLPIEGIGMCSASARCRMSSRKSGHASRKPRRMLFRAWADRSGVSSGWITLKQSPRQLEQEAGYPQGEQLQWSYEA